MYYEGEVLNRQITYSTKEGRNSKWKEWSEFHKKMDALAKEIKQLKTEESILKIKNLGKKVGVSLNPESKLDLITNYLEKIDLVLIMSVNPGFGGQKFMPEVLDKVKQLKKIQSQDNMNFDIEIDGGINFDNCKTVIEAGANILVSGTTVFKSNNGDIKKNINLLKLK